MRNFSSDFKQIISSITLVVAFFIVSANLSIAQTAAPDSSATAATAGGGGAPTGALADAINAKWGSLDAFKEAFVKSAVGNFGSGWTWLVKKADGSVDIVNTGAAGTPLTTADTALLTVDVWEHAYYIDYRNLRQKFVETFLANLVNWEFAEKNFA